jgi:hypothetical protein
LGIVIKRPEAGSLEVNPLSTPGLLTTTVFFNELLATFTTKQSFKSRLVFLSSFDFLFG